MARTGRARSEMRQPGEKRSILFDEAGYNSKAEVREAPATFSPCLRTMAIAYTIPVVHVDKCLLRELHPYGEHASGGLVDGSSLHPLQLTVRRGIERCSGYALRTRGAREGTARSPRDASVGRRWYGALVATSIPSQQETWLTLRTRILFMLIAHAMVDGLKICLERKPERRGEYMHIPKTDAVCSPF